MDTANQRARLLRNVRKRTTQLDRVLKDLIAPPHAEPIFVVGHQKSGTTAIAALLAAAIDEDYSHDMSYRRRWPDVADICNGRVPVRNLVKRARADFACAVIKDPDFTFIVPQLHAYFEKARFIFILRDPRDNIRSVLNWLAIPGNLARLCPEHLATLRNFPGWSRVLDPDVFGFTADHYIEVLAHRWCLALDRGTSVPNRLLIVKYEDFLREKSSFIGGLADWLGAPIRAGVAPIINRQFQPAGQTNINLTEFYGQNNLARIMNVCASRMAPYGYA